MKKAFVAMGLVLGCFFSLTSQAKVRFDCSISNQEAQGLLFASISMLSGGDGSVTGDTRYDDQLKRYVAKNINDDDGPSIIKELWSSGKMNAIDQEGQKLRSQGLVGEPFMSGLAKFYTDPANGLCHQE